MQRQATDRNGRNSAVVPKIGDRVERIRAGVTQSGTVHYADELQVLVKWDDGRSNSLRIGRDPFRVAAKPPHRTTSTAASPSPARFYAERGDQKMA